MRMKMLWKVPATFLLLIVSAPVFFVLMVPSLIATAFWLPLAVAGATDTDPPFVWLYDGTGWLMEKWMDV